jgi:putative hydrolase of the HAD superfamily
VVEVTLKGVLFDLGGTLIQTSEIPQIFKSIFRIYGVEVDRDKILAAHEANQEELSVEEGLVEQGYSFWRKYNLRLLSRLGINNNAEFLAAKIDELWWDYADLQFYTDAKETLTQLKSKQIKLGIVTNAVKKDYDQILQKLGAELYFDVVVGLDSCNKAKPNKEIFLYALKRLQLRPAEALFVGDSVERDYEGAKRTGMKPLLIDRRRKDIKNVDSINDLTKVLNYF